MIINAQPKGYCVKLYPHVQSGLSIARSGLKNSASPHSLLDVDFNSKLSNLGDEAEFLSLYSATECLGLSIIGDCSNIYFHHCAMDFVTIVKLLKTITFKQEL